MPDNVLTGPAAGVLLPADVPGTDAVVSWPATDPRALAGELDAILADLLRGQYTSLGFPAAVDLPHEALAGFLRLLLNNLGDPGVDGAYPQHTKALERDAVGKVADLLRAPVADRWGYVTSGASEGTEHALWLARTRFPGAVVYHSAAAHHCVPQAVDRLAMGSVVIRATGRGEVDYEDLAAQVDRRRDRPAVVVANVGTAITEAVDDVRRVTAVLDRLAVARRWVHADAALSGIPLALLDPGARPGFDFADGADSVILSGHKFLGSPLPYGVLVVRDSLRPYSRRQPTYTGSPDTTLSNSRSGLAALVCWYSLRLYGTAGLRDRAARCRDLADYACRRLTAIGIPAWRHPWAFTVNFPTPPAEISETWVLAGHGGVSHIITMPGTSREQVDALVHAFEALSVAVISEPGGPPKQRRRRLPAPILG